MLNLRIQHNIYLTHKERYELHEGKDQIVVGVSIPVFQEELTSNEPAHEIFCLYHLKNNKVNEPIKIMNSGYEISIPYRESQIPELSNEKWLDWTMNHPEKMERYYSKCKSEVSSKNLLDYKDGGIKCLHYRERNKIKAKEAVDIWHNVSINDIEYLNKSLAFFKS